MALYEAVFLGLGVWRGQAVWTIVQACSPSPVVVFALSSAAVAGLLVGRWLVRRFHGAGTSTTHS